MIGTSKKAQISAAIIAVAGWILIGGVIFHSLEDWTWIESIYFATVTVTTIGYGDLHPTSDLTRIVDVFYILFAVSAALAALNVLGVHRVQERTELREKKLDERARENNDKK